MKFINRVLVALDKIYGFDQGATATDQLSLAAGVQLIHNVARESEFASGVGKSNGWMSFASDTIHAGAGTLTTSFAIHDQARLQGYDSQRHDLWLMDVALVPSLVAPFFTSANVGTELEPLQGGNTSRWIVRFTGSVGTAALSWGLPDLWNPHLPLHLVHQPGGIGCNMVATSTVGAAGTVYLNYLCWVGAKGVFPPRVA